MASYINPKNLKIMKKVLFLGLALLALASCKKEYTCTYDGGISSATYSEKDYTSAQMDALKSVCTAAGGTWAAK